jgi:acyl-CoA synthetase (AMP-forming)/AMP-acid ligase II
MMKGYLNAPRATEETIKRGYVYTGDLATVDKDGYIYLTGRKKDVITTQGKMLIPMEIEDVIYSHPEVFETVVIGVPDETLGEAIKAVVVLKKGGEVTEKEIIELCQQRLPDYAVPKSVDFIERLPRSPATGKILRRMLRDRYAEA